MHTKMCVHYADYFRLVYKNKKGIQKSSKISPHYISFKKRNFEQIGFALPTCIESTKILLAI